MALTGTKAGDNLLLQYLLSATTPAYPKLRLFSNNHTPTYDDVVGSFTEVAVGGYAAITLSAGIWTFTPADPNSFATGSVQAFTMTGAATAYGYYVTDGAGAVVLWAELFTGGPFVLPAAGGQILVQPVLGLL